MTQPLTSALRLDEDIRISTGGSRSMKILDHGIALPAQRSLTISTAFDEQPAIKVHVEGALSSAHRKLGEFQVDGIEPALRGEPRIQLAFRIDERGEFNADARNLASGTQQSYSLGRVRVLTASDALDANGADEERDGKSLDNSVVTESDLSDSALRRLSESGRRRLSDADLRRFAESMTESAAEEVRRDASTTAKSKAGKSKAAASPAVWLGAAIVLMAGAAACAITIESAAGRPAAAILGGLGVVTLGLGLQRSRSATS